MKEDLINFGAMDSMIGIVTSGDGAHAANIGCLLPNIGLAHRIGPHRLNVKIARRLAETGITALRFDLSGVGDSPNKTSNDVIEQAVSDMRDAMDHMQRHYGVERFIVFGICSGAQNGYFLALRDPRIVGLMMYDGFDYPSLTSKLRHRIQQVRISSWQGIAGAIRNRLVPGGTRANEDIFEAALNEMQPSPSEFRAALDALVTRNVAVCAFYSGSRRATDRNRGLLGGLRSPALLDKITYLFDGQMDHTATSQESQDRLLQLLTDWVSRIPRP